MPCLLVCPRSPPRQRERERAKSGPERSKQTLPGLFITLLFRSIIFMLLPLSHNQESLRIHTMKSELPTRGFCALCGVVGWGHAPAWAFFLTGKRDFCTMFLQSKMYCAYLCFSQRRGAHHQRAISMTRPMCFLLFSPAGRTKFRRNW